MNKLKRILPVLAALVLALLLEVFAFNWRSVFSLGGEWTPLPEPAVTDDLAAKKYVNLTFKSQLGYLTATKSVGDMDIGDDGIVMGVQCLVGCAKASFFLGAANSEEHHQCKGNNG